MALSCPRVVPNTPEQRQLVQALARADWVTARQLLAQAQRWQGDGDAREKTPFVATQGVHVDAILPSLRMTLLGWCLSKMPLSQSNTAAELLYEYGACPFMTYTFATQRKARGANRPIDVQHDTVTVFSERFMGNMPFARTWLLDAIEGRRGTSISSAPLRGRALQFDDPVFWAQCLPQGMPLATWVSAFEWARQYSRHPGNRKDGALRRLDWAWQHLQSHVPLPEAQEVVLRSTRHDTHASPLRAWLVAWREQQAQRCVWTRVVKLAPGVHHHEFSPCLFWESIRRNDVKAVKRAWDAMAGQEATDKHVVQEAAVRWLLTHPAAWVGAAHIMKTLVPETEVLRAMIDKLGTPYTQAWEKKGWSQSVAFADGLTKQLTWPAWEQKDADGRTLLQALCNERSQEGWRCQKSLLPNLARRLPAHLWLHPQSSGKDCALDLLRQQNRALAQECQALVEASLLAETIQPVTAAAPVRRQRL